MENEPEACIPFWGIDFFFHVMTFYLRQNWVSMSVLRNFGRKQGILNEESL